MPWEIKFPGHDIEEVNIVLSSYKKSHRKATPPEYIGLTWRVPFKREQTLTPLINI